MVTVDGEDVELVAAYAAPPAPNATIPMAPIATILPVRLKFLPITMQSPSVWSCDCPLPFGHATAVCASRTPRARCLSPSRGGADGDGDVGGNGLLHRTRDHSNAEM